MRAYLILFLASSLWAAEYRTPAGERPAIPRPGAVSVLPGGRMLQPLGRQYSTGPGSFGLAVSADGQYVVTANGGPRQYSLSILRSYGQDRYRMQHLVAPRDDSPAGKKNSWRSVFMGLAFAGEDQLYASEGNSGNVRLINPKNGKRRRLLELNRNGFQDSYTGDLAFDPERGLLYVLDQANFRLVTIDPRRRRTVSSIRVGRLPFSLALAPDGKRVYITNIGMFEYKPIPGADASDPRGTGLPFPAFGFPSPEAVQGVSRETARGAVDVPGLGDPNAPESN